MSKKIIEELLAEEKQLLSAFFEKVDAGQLAELAQIIHQTSGIVFITGVGKSGIIAEKFSVTLTSTGSRAFYLSPANALHGDIGILTDKDLMILISKSGETDELLQLIPAMRNKGVRLIAWTSNPKSRLVKACDSFIEIPVERELCPFDVVPTISTTCQMILGDVIAVALMRLKSFSLDDFASNHPAGRIGRRILMKVSDLMLADGQVPLCKPQEKLVDVLVELTNKRSGCVLVVNEQAELQGIFTDGDLRRTLQKYGADALSQPMHAIMTRTPRTIEQQELATKAIAVMEADQLHPITALPVLDHEKRVVGLIRMHDIIQTGL